MPAASCRGSEEGSWLLVLLVVRQSPGPLLSGPLLSVRAIVVPYSCLPKYSKSCWCGAPTNSNKDFESSLARHCVLVGVVVGDGGSRGLPDFASWSRGQLIAEVPTEEEAPGFDSV